MKKLNKDEQAMKDLLTGHPKKAQANRSWWLSESKGGIAHLYQIINITSSW